MTAQRHITAPPRTLLFLGLLLTLSASGATAAETDQAQEFAEVVFNSPGFQQSTMAMITAMVPEGTARAIAGELIAQDQQFVDLLKSELGQSFEKVSTEEIEGLLKRYRVDPRQAWSDSGQGIMALVEALANAPTEIHHYLRRFGCQVGFLTHPVEVAFERARADGKTPRVTPQLIEKLKIMLDPTGQSCDCLFTKLVEGSGPEILTDPNLRIERETKLGELMTSGQCPDPFAETTIEVAS